MNYGLLAFDVELERGTIGTHVKGDRSAHHEGEVDVVMSSGETAQHGNVIGGQVGAKHRFNILIVKFVATADEFSKDDAFAAVENAVHDQHVKQPVDVVHGFSHLLDEQDEVVGQRGVGLGAEVGGERAEVAAYQNALSLTFNILRVCGKFVAGNLAHQQVAHQGAGGVCAAGGKERAHRSMYAHHSGTA